MLARKMIAAMIMLILASMSAADWGFVGSDKGVSRPTYVPGEIIVKFKPEVTRNAVNALATSKGVSVKRKLRLRNRNVHLLKVPSHINEVEFIRQLEKNPDVIYAERNGYVIFMDQLEPNDPNYGQQWALNNTGQAYPKQGGGTASGTNDADIDAPEGWYEVNDVFGRVIIAIVDTGVDMNHPDLANIIWVNTGEIPDNGIDDDDNDFVDDVHGWDFDANDNTPIDYNPNQIYYGHGTHVAGIAAAVTDNNECVAGVAWGCTIMPVEMGDDLASACEGITYAADNGANVINMSWGRFYFSQTLAEAVSSAHDANCVLVAAAGNEGNETKGYPAVLPEVIAVSATDSDDELAWFSSFGNDIDVSAPGKDILSLRISGMVLHENDWVPKQDPNALLLVASGTSMAAPHVAGLAALCLSVDPNLTPDEVRYLIRGSSDDLGDTGWDRFYGEGRINVHNAVHGMMNIPSKAASPWPSNDANTVSTNAHLGWKAASGALSNNVYFGTDFNDVNGANTLSDEFMGNQSDNNFDPNTLEPNTAYYWRIDEKNNQGTAKGNVWSFRTGLDSVIYVDINATGNDDGTSWSNAFTDLQDALYKAFDDDEIWVAEETYRPTDGNDRLISFELVEGVALYGGFDGTETARNERDWEEHETILSGDIGTINDVTDNSYHVVLGADSAALDGFTITGGNANATFYKCGGGMLNAADSLVVTNCIFKENKSSLYGGGMYNISSSLAVSNCIFSDNTAHSGGGMCNKYGIPVVTRCTFGENSVTYYGGGMYIEDSSPTVTNCIFSGNSASSIGGGIFCFENDSSYEDIPVITNCTISGNSADSGGGICNAFCSPTVTNCILWDNEAPLLGAEIYNFAAEPDFSYCDIEGGLNGSKCDGVDSNDGGGNINDDPCFVDPNSDDFHLDLNSPCINSGDPNGDYSGQRDIDGNPRLMGGRVDMGADEYYESGAFCIKNDSGVDVAWFDNLGNIALKGTLEPNTTPTATGNDEFRFQDSNGVDVVIIDATDGNMYIKGSKHENHNMVLYGQHRFIVQDSNGDRVAYINELGDLYLKGELYENAEP